MLQAREAGILLHPTSLPGRYGIGDLGESAMAWIDFLAESGMRLWQILPLGPTGYGNSPYQTLSAFAGNHLLISIDQLIRDGLLPIGFDALPRGMLFPPQNVHFERVIQLNRRALSSAFERFSSLAFQSLKAEFETFRHQNQQWLPNYAMFKALKDDHQGREWTSWEKGLVHREKHELDRWRARLAREIEQACFEQFLFARQWRQVKELAASRQIRIIGDVPIFIAHDSADVWAHQELFALDDDGRPAVVAGVPPDYFSETGQLWGNPLYDWGRMAGDNYSWWTARIRHTLSLVDFIRLDHFRGFEAYWEVPAGEETAVHGRWVKGPGRQFFSVLQHAVGELPLIAEDLGVITPEVEALRRSLGFPGMKILQFGFGEDPGSRAFLPHHHERNSVVYTGTHDNDTILGWFLNRDERQNTLSKEQNQKERDRARAYLGADGEVNQWHFIRLAFSSVARMAIIPMQDILGLGSEARMNRPGKSEGNWEWRFTFEQVTEELKRCLARLVDLYDRQGNRIE